MVCLLWLLIPVALLIIILLIVALVKLLRRPIGWIKGRGGVRPNVDVDPMDQP